MTKGGLGSRNDPNNIAKMLSPFSEIVALAKDPTPSGRRRLASCFGETFFIHASRFSPMEKNMALEIMAALIRDAEQEIRRELAQRFSRETSMPHALALALANDDAIDVAKPILQRSPVLRDEDLIGVIEKKGTLHRMAIANRTQMGGRVAEALAQTGEPLVSMTLLQNISVHLSEKTIRLLADQALEQTELSHSLIQRPEITPELAEKVYWLVSEELRQNIAQRFDLNRSVLDNALQTTVSVLITKANNEETRRSLSDRLLSSGAVTSTFMVELLKARGVGLYKELLAGLTEFSAETVEVLCQPHMSEALALVFRAFNYSRADTASLLMLTRDRVGQNNHFNPSNMAKALTAFDRLTLGDARTVLWQWQSDPSYLMDHVRENLA